MTSESKDIDNGSPEDWRNQFDERQLKEIAFATTYEAGYAHGTDGHHRLIIIAKLAALLDTFTSDG